MKEHDTKAYYNILKTKIPLTVSVEFQHVSPGWDLTFGMITAPFLGGGGRWLGAGDFSVSCGNRVVNNTEVTVFRFKKILSRLFNCSLQQDNYRLPGKFN